MFVRQLAGIVPAVLLLGGCTLITIDGDAKTTVARLGLLRIEAPQARTIVYRTRGLGIVPGRNGVTIGASDETAALVFAKDDCRIILFRPRAQELDALRKTLAAAAVTPNTVCILGEKKP